MAIIRKKGCRSRKGMINVNYINSKNTRPEPKGKKDFNKTNNERSF